jgi:hypothetical protein
MARTRKTIKIGDAVKMTESAKQLFNTKNPKVIFFGERIVKDILQGGVVEMEVNGELKHLNVNFLERVI